MSTRCSEAWRENSFLLQGGYDVNGSRQGEQSVGKMIRRVVTEDSTLLYPVPATPLFGTAFFCGARRSAGLPLHGVSPPSIPTQGGSLWASGSGSRAPEQDMPTGSQLPVMFSTSFYFLVTEMVFSHSKPCCTYYMSCQIND